MRSDYNVAHVGRIEIRNRTSDVWGTVSGRHFGKPEAKVVCRALGFRGAVHSLSKSKIFGSGNGPVYLGGLKCRGNESDLLDCPYDTWESTSFDHKRDAAIWCTEKRIQSGYVLIFYNSFDSSS